jgi:hypothetical protein
MIHSPFHNHESPKHDPKNPKHGNRRWRRQATSSDRAAEENCSDQKDENEMNSWSARCLAAALMLLAMCVHHWITVDLENTPVDMLLFHGSAALLDLFMLYAAPAVLHGRLCVDTQKLLLASIVGNFAGWLLYIAYVSPIFYNGFMWTLTYTQLLRFFIPDRHADPLGLDLVCHPDHLGGSHHP